MTRISKILTLVITLTFWGCQVEDLVEKPPRPHCGKIVAFWDNDETLEMGNPCWEGYISYPDPRYPDSNIMISEYIKRDLPGNGSYGLVVVNDISGNEKTFCVNDFVFLRKKGIGGKYGGLGTIYCDNTFKSW